VKVENTPSEEVLSLLPPRHALLLTWVKGWAVLSPVILAAYVRLWVEEEVTAGVIGLSAVGVVAEGGYLALAYLAVYRQVWRTHSLAFFLIQIRVLLLVLA